MPSLECTHCGREGEPALWWDVDLKLNAGCPECGEFIRIVPERTGRGAPSQWVRRAPVRPLG